MSCHLHPDAETLAHCTDCNRELCKLCVTKDDGVPYCQTCFAKRKIGKDEMTTLIICSMFGILGIHRLYTGHILTGMIQFFTLGGLGIWAFIDFIAIMRHEFTDAQGQPLLRR